MTHRISSKIIVDAGAVPHVCNGSALMAPGIVKIEGTFSKSTIVLVKEVTYSKIIALSRDPFQLKGVAGVKKGRVALTIIMWATSIGEYIRIWLSALRVSILDEWSLVLREPSFLLRDRGVSRLSC